ncbi:MAG: hypothetical protein K6U14_03105, partial [Firmicutes bacterium]|nr:hypothetical protein [Bacillota bacterium]
HGHGRDGPRWGYLLDHLKRQGVIPVSPDRKTARARFRWLMPAAMRGRRERRSSGGKVGCARRVRHGGWGLEDLALDYRIPWRRITPPAGCTRRAGCLAVSR